MFLSINSFIGLSSTFCELSIISYQNMHRGKTMLVGGVSV